MFSWQRQERRHLRSLSGKKFVESEEGHGAKFIGKIYCRTAEILDLDVSCKLRYSTLYFAKNSTEMERTMTFYQELQLSSTGSKQLIKNTTDKKEKRRHILIYNFKVYLVMVFCVAVVTLYSKLTGSENSVVGVTVLLAVLVLRQADFGIKTAHGLLSIAGIFGILIAGPRLSNMLSPIPAFFVNIFCIMLLMILGCHNVIMYNHSTFVLGYLLLQGYDVSGHVYLLRVEGLLAGMVICMAIFYKNQKNRPYRRTFLDLFREFDLSSARNRWYVKLTFIVSSAMLVMSLLGLPRAMWAGIACMSVCLPFTGDCMGRAEKRGLFNIVGSLIFVALYLILPESMYPYIGMIGGIGVGYSAGYADGIQYVWGVVDRGRIVWTAECGDSAYRCKRFWQCVYGGLQ